LLFLAYLLPFVSRAQEPAASPDFYRTDVVQDIRITFDASNWSYLLDSLRFNGNSLLSGSVSINGTVFEGAGIRYRGSKSFAPGSRRNPLHISLDHTDSSRHLEGYRHIKLSNTLRDPSMIREVLGYEIARKYMPAPLANFARVYVNGEYYGLMANIESVEEAPFLERYFGGAGHGFFKANQQQEEKAPAGCKNNIYGSLEYDESPACYDYNFEKLSAHGTGALIQLAKALNQAPATLPDHLDVDATLWMHAFNNLVVNLSSYSGQHSVNYYLYQDQNGRFVPIIWDLNLAFGSFKNTGAGSDLKIKQLQELDPLLYDDNPTKPLVSKLLENPTWRKQYLSHLRTMLHEQVIGGQLEKRAIELQQLVREAMDQDPGKYYTLADFDRSLDETIGRKSKIPGILELMRKRGAYLKAHPDLSVYPPDITQVQVASRQPMAQQKLTQFHITAQIDKYPKKVVLYYRLDGADGFTEMRMHDDGRTDDGTAANGVYGAIVKPAGGEQSIEYYIVAENAALISYSPADYMWSLHRTSLDEINR
jgi:hypothetical protein